MSHELDSGASCLLNKVSSRTVVVTMSKQHDSVQCPICLHEYAPSEVNKHHLVPKSRGGRETIPLCKPCHNMIHAVYTEKELERNFSTVDELLAAENLQSWIEWVRKRKPTARIRVKTSKQKRRR